MRTPFAWKTYKGCKIIASGKRDPDTGYWIPTGTVYWKRGGEKHLTFINGCNHSYANQSEAEANAMSQALGWCDENIPGELVKAPRR